MVRCRAMSRAPQVSDLQQRNSLWCRTVVYPRLQPGSACVMQYRRADMQYRGAAGERAEVALDGVFVTAVGYTHSVGSQ